MPTHPDNLPSLDAQPVADSLGRVHTNLRISVTDRCNIRCFYCMPDEQIRFQPREELLSFEEIESLVRAVIPMGINRLRITGGEPLVRASLPELIGRLAASPGICDLAMTTNGILLSEQAEALAQAGLQRLNVSLDGLSEETFQQITRRKGLDRVLSGIESARQIGFDRIRLNAVAIRGISEQEIVPLGQFARESGLELRFIEFMPLDAEGNWKTDQVPAGAHAEHAERYREQMASYRAAVAALEGLDPDQVETRLVFLRDGTSVELKLEADQKRISD